MRRVRPIVVAIALVFSINGAYADEGHGKKAHQHGGGHASSLGKPGDPKAVDRTVEVAMSDTMRYSPASISVKQGETIRFVAKNDGKIKHEMVLGTVQELKKHAALMRKFPEMEHADPNQLSVEPGKTGEMVWQFTRAGKFDFACLQPGHYEAGMHGKVMVASAAGKQPAAVAK